MKIFRDIMTQARYKETQLDEARIASTHRGKLLVRMFMRQAKKRHLADYPKSKRKYNNNLIYRTTSMANLFYKWMSEQECDLKTGQNSFVCSFTFTSDKHFCMWQNCIGEEGQKSLYKYLLTLCRAVRKSIAEDEKKAKK